MQGLARRVDDVASGRDVRDRLYLLEQKVSELQLQFRLSSFASETGRRDRELASAGAEAPAPRLSRPGINARLRATLAGRGAVVSPPLTERVLDAVNRASARGLAAARRQRARSPQLSGHVSAEYDRGGRECGVERGDASMAPDSPGITAAPRHISDSSGWCIDGPNPR
jgi:hypothetical protein